MDARTALTLPLLFFVFVFWSLVIWNCWQKPIIGTELLSYGATVACNTCVGNLAFLTQYRTFPCLQLPVSAMCQKIKCTNLLHQSSWSLCSASQVVLFSSLCIPPRFFPFQWNLCLEWGDSNCMTKEAVYFAGLYFCCYICGGIKLASNFQLFCVCAYKKNATGFEANDGNSFDWRSPCQFIRKFLNRCS